MFSCFRPKFSRAPNPIPPKSAPAPQPKVMKPKGAPGTDVVHGMKTHEEPLAGYLLARSAVNRKIEGSVLQNLRAGHETVQQSSDLLSLGRANVAEDIAKAGGEHNLPRHLAAERMASEVLSHHLRNGGNRTPVECTGLASAAAQYARTGTCGPYAAVNATMHAGKLAHMDNKQAVVAVAASKTTDHGWAEFVPRGRNVLDMPILHGTDVIMDGWGKENVAVLREDYKFSQLDQNGKESNLEHLVVMDRKTGSKTFRAMETFKAKIEKSRYFQGVFKTEFNRLVDEKFEAPKSYIYAPTSLFHPELNRTAGAALHKEAMSAPPGSHIKLKKYDPVSKQAKHASMAEIQAIGVARSLGSNIRGAKTEAPGIIASAKRLFPEAPPEVNSGSRTPTRRSIFQFLRNLIR